MAGWVWSRLGGVSRVVGVGLLGAVLAAGAPVAPRALGQVEPPPPPELPDFDELSRFPPTPQAWNERYPDDPVEQPFRRGPDVDGDGYPDIVFPGVGWGSLVPARGWVSVMPGWWGSEALWRVEGEGLNDMFAHVAVGVGDVTGDGREELLVTAPRSDAGAVDAGRAYVLHGLDGSILLTFTSDRAGTLFGFSGASVGDLNGDGRNDYAIAGPGGEGEPGYVAIFHGPDLSQGRVDLTLADAAAVLEGEGPNVGFGADVGPAGDFDADGTPDVLIGVSHREHGPQFDPPPRGGAEIVSGSTLRRIVSITGSSAGEFAGLQVCEAGDVNGDGFDDVLIASPGRLFFEEDGSVTNTSRLSLFHGRAAEAEALALTTAEADLTVHPINDEKWLGGSDLARENDFDGDGVRDFRTSAKEFSIDANGILSWEDPEYILSGVDLSILNAVRVAPADPFDAGDAGDADDADAVGEPEAVMLPGDVDGDGDVDEMDLTDIVGRVGRATYAGRG